MLLGHEGVWLGFSDTDGRTPRICAASGGHQEVVKILVGKDVKPDRSGNGGRTPLLCTASGRHEGVVKILLGREEVKLNKRDK